MSQTRARSRWIVPEAPDPEAVAALCRNLSLSEQVATLLLIRRYTDDESARKFLRPRLDQLRDANLIKGAEAAVDRLVRAVTDGETVLVHGDYDVDGICSTTILIRTLRQFGANAVYFIPNRFTDGYDLGQAGVAAALKEHASLVVTCDCGTSAVEPVAELCAAGIDVIITDHHLPGGALPACLAILNPNQDRDDNPDKDLAAVGVAFKLALALAKKLEKNDAFIWRMLDLVALATIADVAPLTGENRILVRYGLRMLTQTENVGLQAMIRAAGLDTKQITAGRVGYILAPRLNAAGRMKSAMIGVELLLSEDLHRANELARELEQLNEERQAEDRKVLAEARKMVLRMDLDTTYGIVLAHEAWRPDFVEGWHPGVIGIVASRLVEEFGRPTILIALEGNSGKGSGRSISKLHLRDALDECSDLLQRFGGHRMAAGVTIDRALVDDFAKRFNEVAASHLTLDDLIPDVRIDLEVAIECANEDLERMLRHFEPFGVGNPTPVLVARGVRLAADAKAVGRDGLKLRLSAGSGEIEAIGWGMADRKDDFSKARKVDIAFRLERDEFRGMSRLQARIADVTLLSAD